MVSAPWQALADECARWQDLGRPVEFWWRDDDATRTDPALRRLLALSAAAEVPLALAVIPDGAVPALFDDLGPAVSVLQHGCDHLNRAARGEKKCEFPGAEPAESALARLRSARIRLARASGSRALPVLVPPWNRLPAGLVPRLRENGFLGLSRFGPRSGSEAIPGLRQVNAHVDVIAWHAGRGFIGEDAALEQAVRVLSGARARGAEQPDEAVGWLTHHAVHDEPAWRFLERLFELSRRLRGVRWVAASALFSELPDGR
jgi:hypothetical protein